MPPSVPQKSGLFAKFGNRLDNAFKKHMDDPADYGDMRLPGGITNGIAQIVSCKCEQYKSGTTMKKVDGSSAAGEYYIQMRGTVVFPETIIRDGKEFPVKGLQTSKMFNLFDTKNAKGIVTSQDDQIAAVENEFKILLGEELFHATCGDNGAVNLETLLPEALVEAAPYFKFSTSASKATKEYPDPRVFENWYGSKGLEDYTPDASADTQDDTTPAEEVKAPAKNGTPVATKPPPAKPAPTPPKPAPVATKRPIKPVKKAPAPEPEPEVFDETQDTPALLELANLNDGSAASADAQRQLKEMAAAAGASEDDIENADSWDAVAELATGGGSTEAKEEEAPEASGMPEGLKVGDVYNYKTIDPKTGKPAIDPKTGKERKASIHQVEKINEEAGTVDLLNLTNRKLVKGVDWDLLETAD